MSGYYEHAEMEYRKYMGSGKEYLILSDGSFGGITKGRIKALSLITNALVGLNLNPVEFSAFVSVLSLHISDGGEE